MRAALPIDALLPEILASLARSRSLVIEAPPGAGKTTRVPPALLGVFTGGVLVLEPRRIAARLAARRVAEELGERLGETVGYQVRFEDVTGPRTRLRFMTEGVLNRRLLSDPQLQGVSAVILDEFHERHLEGDLALALVRRLQQTLRPDLRIVVMSATLDAAPISRYLDRCPVLRSEGRLHDVQVQYRGHSAAPLEEQVAAAAEELVERGLDGDMLVFLPGAAEIRRAARACEAMARRAGLLLLPLHGDLSPDEQDWAVRPAEQRKIVLSTNVAESSITIDGVTAVIDSGLARFARDSHWTGLPTLEVQRISKASAVQRAGRAGRTRPGRVLRLYTPEDFARRRDADPPEISRRELSQVMLDLDALGVPDPPWFERPPEEAVRAARGLLSQLGVAQHSREMARYPLHPRLSRMLIEAARRGASEDACRVAAVLSSGDRVEETDLLHAIDRELPSRTEQIRRQIRKLTRQGRSDAGDDALLLSVLAGFPDRVAKRRTEREVQLMTGVAAAHNGASEFLVALDIEDRSDQPLPLIRLAAPLDPEWLIELSPEAVEERSEIVWNRQAQRAERTSSLAYGALTIWEHREAAPASEETAAMVAERALEAGLHHFIDPGELETFLARVAFAANHAGVPQLTDEDVRAGLLQLAEGTRSFAELQRNTVAGGLLRVLRQRLGAAARLLDEVAPERIAVGRRQVRVQYARGRQPWIESRLQDFFGMRETPRVARGAVPLVVHLLAPNQRPVQTTSDLAGFWERLYPQVRRELMRRYPKHAWPERPELTPERR